MRPMWRLSAEGSPVCGPHCCLSKRACPRFCWKPLISVLRATASCLANLRLDGSALSGVSRPSRIAFTNISRMRACSVLCGWSGRRLGSWNRYSVKTGSPWFGAGHAAGARRCRPQPHFAPLRPACRRPTVASPHHTPIGRGSGLHSGHLAQIVTRNWHHKGGRQAINLFRCMGRQPPQRASLDKTLLTEYRLETCDLYALQTTLLRGGHS